MPHATLNPTPEELAVYKDLRVDAKDFPSWMRQYVEDARNPTQQMRAFCAAITGLDRQVGRLLDFLDAEGLSKNTIVFFSSDDGPEDYHVGNAANAGMGSPGSSGGGSGASTTADCERRCWSAGRKRSRPDALIGPRCWRRSTSCRWSAS